MFSRYGPKCSMACNKCTRYIYIYVYMYVLQ